MPKGRGHRNHKGQMRHFTNPDELEYQRKKEERERQWRQQRGIESDEDEDEDGEKKTSSQESGSGSESEGGEDEKKQTSIVEGLIEVENPNRAPAKAALKAEAVEVETAKKPELSRREREELEKQKRAANYQRLHAQGKTDEARADLARLAIIKKQREDAAKKRAEEIKLREEAKAAKTDALNKALGKGRKT